MDMILNSAYLYGGAADVLQNAAEIRKEFLPYLRDELWGTPLSAKHDVRYEV